jgi:peroxiredoxin
VRFASAPEVRGTYRAIGFPLCKGSALAALALIVGIGSLLAGPAGANDSPPARTSASDSLVVWSQEARPAFRLSDIDQREIALEAQRGRIVLVHFFATWCEPCREELPALSRLAQRTDPQALRILAISVAEPDARVRNFMARMSPSFPVLLDRDRGVAKAWGVSALPTTFVLDRDLNPRLFIERDYDWDRFDITDAEKLSSMGGSQ